jgi:hypothetical protein
MFGAPERLPAFGARTVSTVITTFVVQDLKEQNRWRWLSDALIIHCVARIVAEPKKRDEFGWVTVFRVRIFIAF